MNSEAAAATVRYDALLGELAHERLKNQHSRKSHKTVYKERTRCSNEHSLR